MSFLSEYLELRRKQRDTEREQYEFEAQSPEEILESVNSNTEFTADLVGTRNKDARKQHKALLDSLGSIGESLVATEFSEELIVDGIENASDKEQALSKVRNESLSEISEALKELVDLNKKLEKYLRPELNPKDDTYAKRKQTAAAAAPRFGKKEGTKEDTSASDWIGSLFDFGPDKKNPPKSAGKKGGRAYRKVPSRPTSYRTPKLPQRPPAGRFGRFMSSAKTALGSVWTRADTAIRTTFGKKQARIDAIRPQSALKVSDLPKSDLPKGTVQKADIGKRLKDAVKVIQAKSTDTLKTVTNNNTTKTVIDRIKTLPKVMGNASSKAVEAAKPVVSKASSTISKGIGAVNGWIKPDAVAKTTARAAAAPSAMGRIGTFLGRAATPLAIAASGYEAYNTEQRTDLTRDEKNVKHGGTAGGLAGALAGAKIGGAVGGTAGAAFMGIGALPGAIVGALTGGLAGYFGGSALGEKAVSTYQEATSKVADLPEDIKHHVGETAVELQKESNAQADNNLQRAQEAIAVTNTDATNASIAAVTAASNKLSSATSDAAGTLADGSKNSASILGDASKQNASLISGTLAGMTDTLSKTWDSAKEAFKEKTSSLFDSSSQFINRISVQAGDALRSAGQKVQTSANGTIFEKPADLAGRTISATGRGIESGGGAVASTLASGAAAIRPMRQVGPAVVPEGKAAVNKATQQNWEKYGADIVSAADRYGVDPAAMAKIMRVESGNFDATVDTQRQNWLAGKAGASSAAGLGQFVDATWAEQLRRHGSENAETSKHVAAAKAWIADKRGTKEKHLDPAYREMLEAKRDPKANALMSAAFTKGNMKLLEKSGVTNASEAELYSVHMTGNTKAAKAYRNNPNAPIEQVFTPAEIKNNPGYFRNSKTVGDVINSMQSKLDAGKAYGEAATQMAKNIKDPASATALAEKTPDTKVSVAKSDNSNVGPKATEVKVAAARVDKAAASEGKKTDVKVASSTKPVTTMASDKPTDSVVTDKVATPSIDVKGSPKVAAVEARPYAQVLPKADKSAYDSLSFTKPEAQAPVFSPSIMENTPASQPATVLSSRQSPLPRLAASTPQEVAPVEVTNPQSPHQGNQSSPASHNVGNAFDTAVPKLDNVPLQVTDLGLVLLNIGHI